MTLRKRSCPAVSQICRAEWSRGISHNLVPPPGTLLNPAPNPHSAFPRGSFILLLPGPVTRKMTSAIDAAASPPAPQCVEIMVRGKGLPACSLMGKSIGQMDEWGPTDLIHQFLMQRCARRGQGGISTNGVTELRAEGSGKQEGSQRAGVAPAVEGHGISCPSPEQAPVHGAEQPKGLTSLGDAAAKDGDGDPASGVLLC